MVKYILGLVVLVFSFVNSYGIAPTTILSSSFESGSETIEEELSDLEAINKLVVEQSYDYNYLQENHSQLVSQVRLSHRASRRGVFEGHPDNPLGVPAFWWGCCLSWIGILIVYTFMDEGEQRKEEVKKALVGCLFTGCLYFLVYAIAIVESLN